MPGAYDETLHRMYDRVGVDDLPAHLTSTYGIDVAGVTALDVGVLRVDRGDGPPWVARVFAATRAEAATAADAAALRHLAEHDFPAERLAADEPTSTLHGQQVLVTEFVAEAAKSKARRVPFGALLGRLHTLPLPTGPAARPAGALHHYAEGTRRDELAAALAWLDQMEDRIAPTDRSRVERLRAELRDADAGEGLPVAFIHPDPVAKNIIRTADGPVLVDWSGAGVGPRVVALEYVLGWPTTSAGLVAEYSQSAPLTDEEWERLPAIALSRRLVTICFRLGFQAQRASTLTTRINAARREAETCIAAAGAGARP